MSRLLSTTVAAGHRQRGATLASTLVAIFIVAICLSMTLQGYIQGSRARKVQQRRSLALTVCQQRIETRRARGYRNMPQIGQRLFAIQKYPELRGEIEVATGPVAASKAVTVTVSWPTSERIPAGDVSLSTIFSARGISR